MAFKMSKATTDDRVVLPKMAENLTGKIIGDKGYISQKLFDQLYEKGLQLITKIRKNMKNKLVLMIDKILLRKRGIRKRRYLGRYFAHPMMQNRRAKRDDYKPSAVRVTQRYVP